MDRGIVVARGPPDHEGIEMTETSTSLSVIGMAALGALAFFASFGAEYVPFAQIASALLFPAIMLVLIVGGIGLIRVLLAMQA